MKNSQRSLIRSAWHGLITAHVVVVVLVLVAVFFIRFPLALLALLLVALGYAIYRIVKDVMGKREVHPGVH